MSQEEVWDKIAKEWKDYRTKASPTAEKFLNEISGKVLDLGCGSGRNFIKKEDIEWYACDFSSEMIKHALKNARSKKINVKIEKCNAENLPYKDNFFDAVLCFSLLHCIDSSEKREAVISEIYRVLKVGGKALISCWGPKSPRLKNKGKECYVPWNVKGEKRQERYTYVFSLDELADLCERKGFRVIKKFEERNVNVIVEKKD